MSSPSLLRDENNIAHIAGLSFGKDSVCMALALKEKEPRPYNFVCTPTGDELPEMVAHMDRIETLLGQKVIHLTNGTLASLINQMHMLPNFRSRFCTRLLKLKPFGEFMTANAPVVAYVGLRDDEDEREGTRPGGAARRSEPTSCMTSRSSAGVGASTRSGRICPRKAYKFLTEQTAPVVLTRNSASGTTYGTFILKYSPVLNSTKRSGGTHTAPRSGTVGLQVSETFECCSNKGRSPSEAFG